jgi:hypothetical protein
MPGDIANALEACGLELTGSTPREAKAKVESIIEKRNCPVCGNPQHRINYDSGFVGGVTANAVHGGWWHVGEGYIYTRKHQGKAHGYFGWDH